MSEHDATETAAAESHAHPAPNLPLNELFEPNEIAQFEADDTEAGKNIGKMLSIFFLYTLIAMSIAGYWTYRSVSG